MLHGGLLPLLRDVMLVHQVQVVGPHYYVVVQVGWVGVHQVHRPQLGAIHLGPLVLALRLSRQSISADLAAALAFSQLPLNFLPLL